ncbi:MAG TPA: hypothetical protein VNG33_07100 [Polyangiaceae bacterium]|nr:hypothetical protein [Polyangiaceae bacterium]
MDLFSLPERGATPVLRALKSVALANGSYDEGERALLRAAASAYALDIDVDALEPIDADSLAAALTSPEERLRTLQACMLMTVADAEVSPAEVVVLDAFRKALGVDEPRLAVLRSIASDHKRFARLHLLRTAVGGRSQLKGARFSDMLRVFGMLPANKQLADKYRALALFPDGTMGREYARYMEKNKFSWPGEKGGIPEPGLHHDFTHVLTGYDTDPLGEIEIGSFTAGMKQTDPFFFLLFVMLEFHLGLAARPATPAFPGHYDAERAVRAHQRGVRCKRDLTDGWDWWADMQRPVNELRAKYGIA